MLYAIIADIHANLPAFAAVLDDIKTRGRVEAIWCLGDIVGYGPDPHECLALLRQTNHVCVAGNHDWASIGKLDVANFNPDAATAALWTKQQLDADDVEYLENLPLIIKRERFTLVHGSPREPIWEYLVSISIARENFVCMKSQICLVGHSHIPRIFKYSEGMVSSSQFLPDIGLILGDSPLIINPGAVGQPRDGDPRASYAIYDSEARTIRLYRVAYDIDATQARMLKHNLPLHLIARLNHGI